MRKLIPIIIGIVLVVGALFLAKNMINNKQKPKQKPTKIVKTVFVEKVTNTDIPIIISANGNLESKKRIELFAEVQGVLMDSQKDFKPGTNYNRGEAIVRINSDEFYANLQAQKSNFFNTLTSVMPDIQLDFPDEYEKWYAYLNDFNMNEPLKELPKTNSDKEKFFIAGRGVMTSYYNVHNLEVKLSKYVLRAPFTGILTEASVNPGMLVRPGQKLGEFINTSVYEMAVSVKSAYRDLLQVGKAVQLYNLEQTRSWTGKVVRINGKVDTKTQTIKAFIEVKGDDLKDGQYLEIALEAKQESNAIEIPRNLLIQNSMMYVVKDSVLALQPVEPVFENKNTVVVKGLENDMIYLAKPVPGAYAGMRVKIFNDQTTAQ